mmetsp:Transcript_135986/g.254120  ORF Transcript_135986/g.254120 Transcript_135986/m.254120 type:complete len:271 (-) Transcript_135986:611-1423(-)
MCSCEVKMSAVAALIRPLISFSRFAYLVSALRSSLRIWADKSRNISRVAVMQRQRTACETFSRTRSKPLINSSSLISKSVRAASSKDSSQRSKRPSLTSRSSPGPVSPDSCSFRRQVSFVRIAFISSTETLPLWSRSVSLKSVCSRRFFSLLRCTLCLASVSSSSRLRALSDSSMKMAGTREIKAMDVVKIKTTKNINIPGFTLITLSHTDCQSSNVISLNIAHMELGRFANISATIGSRLSHSMFVAIMEDTKSTKATIAANFKVAVAA